MPARQRRGTWAGGRGPGSEGLEFTGWRPETRLTNYKTTVALPDLEDLLQQAPDPKPSYAPSPLPSSLNVVLVYFFTYQYSYIHLHIYIYIYIYLFLYLNLLFTYIERFTTATKKAPGQWVDLAALEQSLQDTEPCLDVMGGEGEEILWGGGGG